MLNQSVRRLSIFWLFLMVVWTSLPSANAQIQLSPVMPAPSQGEATGSIGSTKGQAPAAESAARSPAEIPNTAPAASQPDYAIADQATGMKSAESFQNWTSTLNDIDQLLNASRISYNLLDRSRGRLEKLRAETDKYIGQITPKVAEAKAQVDNLGPVPETGDPEPVAAQRAQLQQIFGNLTAARNVAESAKLRANQITTKIQDLRRKKFTERLFERVPEAHSAYTWENAPSQFSFVFQKVWQTISAWWIHLDRRGDAILLLVIGTLIAIGTTITAQRGIVHFRIWNEPEEPPYWRRTTSAAIIILLRTLPVTATASFLYVTFHYQGLMSENVDLLAYSALRSLLIITGVFALTATALAPHYPQWRLLPMSNQAAERIRWLVLLLSILYSFTLFLDTVRYAFNASFTLTVAQSFISSILIALMVIAILLTPRGPLPKQDDIPQLQWMRHLHWPLWGIAILILLAALIGYIGLARFISAQLIVTGTVICVVYLLLAWVDAVGENMTSEEGALGSWLRVNAELDQRRRDQLSLPVTLMLKSGVLLFMVPLILLQWGFDWKDISEWGSRALFGFKIGETEISFAAIIGSIIVFVLGYLLARFVQNWLDRRVLETAGFSGGARHSIRTAVGYAGIVVAALLAISYAGLDLSNIALVAGALSVGIGLGLQGVVNNFVSGLILLAERPIKVGDWVVVGDEQGIVKKISVRATEIETFDRANVLIPNASFMTSNVKNWTLHNYSGRVTISIGVHYSSDARQVYDLLLKVAGDHPMVMKTPGPFVYFDDFGADALNFTLYIYTFDITKSLGLRTELRIRILEAFREANIEIPYRQTDIHLKNLEVMKELLPFEHKEPKASHGRQSGPLQEGPQETPAQPKVTPKAGGGRQGGGGRNRQSGSRRG